MIIFIFLTYNYMEELLKRQLNIITNKLSYKDIVRIYNFLDPKSTIFGKECCLWKGYVTNTNSIKTSPYINFYYKRKKVMLHRLLYMNYVGSINDDEFLKLTCKNKGYCCNINHMEKHAYKRKEKKIKLIKNNNDNISDIIIIF